MMSPALEKWARCRECGAEVMFDAWVDCNGELMEGPFDDCRCSNGDCDAINPDYDMIEGNRPIKGEPAT